MAARVEDLRGHRPGARPRASRSPPARIRSRPSSGPTTPPSPTTTTPTRRSRSAATREALVLEDGVSVRVRTESELGATALRLLQPRRDRFAGVRAAVHELRAGPADRSARAGRGRVQVALARAAGGAAGVHRARDRARVRAARRGLRVPPRGGPAGAEGRGGARGADTQIVYDGIDDAQAAQRAGDRGQRHRRVVHARARAGQHHAQQVRRAAARRRSRRRSGRAPRTCPRTGSSASSTPATRSRTRPSPAPSATTGTSCGRTPRRRTSRPGWRPTAPRPPVPAPAGTTTVMSPRRGLELLDDYATRRRLRAAGAVHDVRVRHEPALPRRLPAPVDDVLRVALMEKEGNGARARRGQDLHRQAAPAAQRPGRGRQEQERHRAGQLEARAHRRDRHQRRLGAHQVHARRPARARPDRRSPARPTSARPARTPTTRTCS